MLFEIMGQRHNSVDTVYSIQMHFIPEDEDDFLTTTRITKNVIWIQGRSEIELILHVKNMYLVAASF